MDGRFYLAIVVGLVLLLAAWLDHRDRRRPGLHRRRTGMALWVEIDERASGMRAGEHGLGAGLYVPETVPWRSGRADATLRDVKASRGAGQRRRRRRRRDHCG